MTVNEEGWEWCLGVEGIGGRRWVRKWEKLKHRSSTFFIVALALAVAVAVVVVVEVVAAAVMVVAAVSVMIKYMTPPPQSPDTHTKQSSRLYILLFEHFPLSCIPVAEVVVAMIK